jgi:hypothetical protein
MLAQSSSGDLAMTGPATASSAVPQDSGTNGLELVSFETYPTNDATTVSIRWTTFSEEADGQFIVECSSDRMNWKEVLEVPSANSELSYMEHEAIDPSPLSDISYYRLSLYRNGITSQLSDDFAMDLPKTEALAIEGGPVPGRFTVEGSGLISNVQLLNDRGQFVPMELDYQGDRVRVNAELLSAGRYYVKAVVDGKPALRLLVITPNGIIAG